MEKQPLDVCNKKLANAPGNPGKTVTSNMFCAKGKPRAGVIGGTCKGDSGGPFVCRDAKNGRWVLDGLVSWGSARFVQYKMLKVFDILLDQFF